MATLKRRRFEQRGKQIDVVQRSLLEESGDEDLAREILHADETPLPMLKPGLGRTHRTYLRSCSTT
jgi:transposase